MIAVLRRGRRAGRIGRSGASPDAGVPDARTGAEPYERKSSTKIRPRLESRRKRSGLFRASFARVEKSGLWAIIEPEQSRSSRRREAHVRDVHVRKHEEARRADPCGTAFRAGCLPVVRSVRSSVRVSFVHGPLRPPVRCERSPQCIHTIHICYPQMCRTLSPVAKLSTGIPECLAEF